MAAGISLEEAAAQCSGAAVLLFVESGPGRCRREGGAGQQGATRGAACITKGSAFLSHARQGVQVATAVAAGCAGAEVRQAGRAGGADAEGARRAWLLCGTPAAAAYVRRGEQKGVTATHGA
jgi:hypothetical protein